MRPRWWWAAAPLLAASLWRGAGAEHGGSHAPHAAFSVSRARVLLEPGAVVSVNATVLVGASSWVTVSWSLPASVSPNASDLLALYLASASVTASAPLKFKPATGAHTGSTRRVSSAALAKMFLAHGQPSPSFQILNQRAPVVFYYFLGGPSGALVNPTAVAVSPQLSFANPNGAPPVHARFTTPARSDVDVVSFCRADEHPPGADRHGRADAGHVEHQQQRGRRRQVGLVQQRAVQRCGRDVELVRGDRPVRSRPPRPAICGHHHGVDAAGHHPHGGAEWPAPLDGGVLFGWVAIEWVLRDVFVQNRARAGGRSAGGHHS